MQNEESALGFTCKSRIPSSPALGRELWFPLPRLLQISCKTTLRADLSARPAGSSSHISHTGSSALPANAGAAPCESQRICRISATCTPKLTSKCSAHSKRGVMKKLNHPTVEVTRRPLANITLPVRRQVIGAGFQQHNNLRCILMHLTNTPEEIHGPIWDLKDSIFPQVRLVETDGVFPTSDMANSHFQVFPATPPRSLIQCHPSLKQSSSSTFMQLPDF